MLNGFPIKARGYDWNLTIPQPPALKTKRNPSSLCGCLRLLGLARPVDSDMLPVQNKCCFPLAESFFQAVFLRLFIGSIPWNPPLFFLFRVQADAAAPLRRGPLTPSQLQIAASISAFMTSDKKMARTLSFLRPPRKTKMAARD